jgi:hypothetical protein
MRFLKLTTALVIAAGLVPAGAQAAQDLPSPDTRDAAAMVESRQDLRSPDTRDAAALVESRQDLRSPDTRDAAERNGFAPGRSVVVSVSRSVPAAADGFEWGDAGIGAVVTLGLMGAAGGALLAVGRRRAATV